MLKVVIIKNNVFINLTLQRYEYSCYFVQNSLKKRLLPTFFVPLWPITEMIRRNGTKEVGSGQSGEEAHHGFRVGTGGGSFCVVRCTAMDVGGV